MRKQKSKNKVKRTLARKILNFFIGLFGIFVFLIIVLFGYMQTSSFREWLNEQITSSVNESINGNLNIKSIEGTVLTSLYLNDISLTVQKDTLFRSQKIGIKINPLELLLGRIYIHDCLIENSFLDLSEYEDQQTLIDRLGSSAQSTQDTLITDESPGEFPFVIFANNIEVNNLHLRKKSFANLNSNRNYVTLDFNDLVLDSLFFHARAAADLNNNNFRLMIEHLSAVTNSSRFRLMNLSGSFTITDHFAQVNKLNIKSENLDLLLSARLDSINLFKPIDLADFKDYPISLELKANPFNFDDLTTFIDATSLLDGPVYLDLKTEGKFGDFKIKKLELELSKSDISLTGRLRYLHTPENMYIDAEFSNSTIDYSDVLKLLPKLDIPKYENVVLENLNLAYSGEPTKFRASGSADIDESEISFDTFLDVSSPVMNYDVKLSTNNLDAKKFIAINSNLNSTITIKGQGTKTDELHSSFDCKITNSKFNGYNVKRLSINSNADQNIISFDAKGEVNKSQLNINGELDFSDQINPLYNLSGNFKGFDIKKFFPDQNIFTDLNFSFLVDGKYLDLDNTVGNFKVELDSSFINGKFVDNRSISLNLDKQNNIRTINLNSGFLDFYTKGIFNITELIDLLVYQGEVTSKVFKEKAIKFVPTADSSMVEDVTSSDITGTDIILDFNFNFKDFSLFQSILENDTIDIAGKGYGNITNNEEKFEFNCELNLDHMVAVDRQNVYYTSGLNVDINLSRDNSETTFSNMLGAVSLSAQRIFTGSDIKNVVFDFYFNEKSIIYYTSAQLSDKLSAEINGNINLIADKQAININKALIHYENMEWKNVSDMSLISKNDTLFLKNIKLKNRRALIELDGYLASEEQNLSLNFSNIGGSILEKLISDSPSDSLVANLYGSCIIDGKYEDPKIDLSFNIDTLAYEGIYFGSLSGVMNYRNEIISTDIVFNSQDEVPKELLEINGTIPIDLSFAGDSNRIPENKNIDLKMKSDQFNLSALGPILPAVIKQKGIINSNLDITGKLDDPIIEGNLLLEDGFFKLRSTNLDYKCGFNIKMKNDILSLSDFYLTNAGGERYGGSLVGSGDIRFNEDGLEQIELKLNGKISILGQATKQVNPYIHGDLFLGSDGDWIVRYNDSKYFLEGKIKLLHSNLTYSSQTAGYYENANDFVYITKIDSSRTNLNEIDFERLLETVNENNGTYQTAEPSRFDFDIEIITEEDAKFTINMSKALGQKLILTIRGNMLIEKIGEEVNTQGSFFLLEGSRLEFIKNFSAVGEIRFEKDLTDPYLDIIASYTGDYISSLDPFQKTKEVAIKLKLNGTVSELGKKLVLDDENLAVYIGRKDIEANIPDTRYDASDALLFIVLGKFKEDLTAGNKIDLAGSSSSGNATGLVLGPVLSGLLNSAIGGGIIEDISISQAGQYTRLGISGKYQNLRYRIGGTTEALSDISKANILVQYFFTNDLSLRLERRYPIIYSEGTADRVNEMGIRYKFEF